MPRLRTRLAPAALSALAALAPTAGAGAELVVDTAIAVTWDSNVSRAQLADDIRADAHLDARGDLAWRLPVGDTDDAVQLALGARGGRFDRHPRLSYAAADAEVAYWRKVGLGLMAPWLRVSARASVEDYREDTRDSRVLVLRAETGRRFSERVDASIGYLYDRRYARHDEVLVPGISGAVWDVAGHTGYVWAAYALTDRWQLDGGYSFRRGDVVSSTHRNLPIFLASDAIGPTDAFGPDFFDYRLRGTTQVSNAAASYALGDRASLNVGYAYGFTRAAQGLQYQNHIVSAAWAYRY